MAVNDENPWPYLSSMFEFTLRAGNSLQFKCLLCLPKKTVLLCCTESHNVSMPRLIINCNLGLSFLLSTQVVFLRDYFYFLLK